MARIVDNVRLPEHLEQGARIGPSFKTSIVTMQNGAEQTNQEWQDELLQIDASYGIMDKNNPYDPEDSYAAILDFFRARRGRARAFLFRDATDWEAVNEPIYAVPTQAGRYQLAKTYEQYIRRITRPDPATLVLKKAGAVVGTSNYTLHGLGQLSFASGYNATGVTASFDFDIPVRFEKDDLQATITHIRAGRVSDIILIQVRE